MSPMTTMRKESRKRARRANKKIAPVASDARDTALKYAETTRDWAAPRVEAARDWAAPRVEPAVSKVKEDVLPKVASAVTAALAASEPAREEAKTRGTAALAALKGEVEAPQPKTHRVRKLFLLAGIVGAAYAGWKAWAGQGRQEEQPWATPLTGTGNVTTTHPITDDAAGASPDEALADAAEEAAVTDETLTGMGVAEAAPAESAPVETEVVTPRQAKRTKKATEAANAEENTP